MPFKRRFAPFLACLALVACAVPTANAVITPAPTVIVPHRDPILVQYCVDDSGNFPRSDFTTANQLMATTLQQSVVPNSGGVVLYATAINSNTFDPSNTLAPFVVPPIANYPGLPTSFPTPPQQNPVSYPATATAAAAQSAPAIATYNAQASAVDSELKVVQGQVARDVTRLTSWNPGVDYNATSVWGCLQLARSRFFGQSAVKYLIIASAMQNTTNQDFTSDFTSSKALSNVHVHVIFYVCHQQSGSGQCEDTTIYWHDVFNKAGAVSVHFDDPAQSQALPYLFGIP